jgi:hypothetical protein
MSMAENLSVATTFSGYIKSIWNFNKIHEMVGYKEEFSFALLKLGIITDKYD